MSDKRSKRRRLKMIAQQLNLRGKKSRRAQLFNNLKPHCDELARKGLLLVSPAVHQIIRTLQEAQAVIE